MLYFNISVILLFLHMDNWCWSKHKSEMKWYKPGTASWIAAVMLQLSPYTTEVRYGLFCAPERDVIIQRADCTGLLWFGLDRIGFPPSCFEQRQLYVLTSHGTLEFDFMDSTRVSFNTRICIKWLMVYAVIIQKSITMSGVEKKGQISVEWKCQPGILWPREMRLGGRWCMPTNSPLLLAQSRNPGRCCLEHEQWLQGTLRTGCDTKGTGNPCKKKDVWSEQ